MKKLILSAVVVAGAMFGAYTANQVNDEVEMAVSDLQLEDVELLAEGDAINFLVQYAGYLNYAYNGQLSSNVITISGMGGSSYLFQVGPGAMNYSQAYIVEDCRYTVTYGGQQDYTRSYDSGAIPVTLKKCAYGVGGCQNEHCAY